MRISDWSSDVCSSDLALQPAVDRRRLRHPRLYQSRRHRHREWPLRAARKTAQPHNRTIAGGDGGRTARFRPHRRSRRAGGLVMTEAFICAYKRTPIGRFGGSLSAVRPDDLGAIPLKALMEAHAGVDWDAVDDVIFGNANQAGEDNRNVARMSLLLAGLPVGVPGTTINRLCGSVMDALITEIGRAHV